MNAKVKELLEKKAQLEKELLEIKKQEYKENKQKGSLLLKNCKKEIQEFQKLSTFKTKGKIKIEVSYDIDMQILLDCDRLYSNEGVKENVIKDIEIEGNCYISTKEPKGYKVSHFLCEDSFNNIGINYSQDVVGIHPELEKQLKNFTKARNNLIKKVKLESKKLGMTMESAIQIVSHFACDSHPEYEFWSLLD